MTIETRYVVRHYGEPFFICESREDALAISKGINGDHYEEDVQEARYLPDYGADDDDDENSIHVMLLRHAHNDDKGGESDD